MTEHKNVVVAVRCRPLNARESKRGVQRLVTMGGQQALLTQPGGGAGNRGEQRQRTYTFDYAYPPVSDSAEAGQESVFNDIGQAVLGHALSGYHCCVFAYGQTGSGKSYTMMGSNSSSKDAGLIPRISQGLFARIEEEQQQEEGVSYHVEVSYLEIYNERVRDLLNPISASNSANGNGGNSSVGLRVREHPSLGPYVEDLTKAAVSTHSEMLAHMVQGNRARTVAATQMNAASSRSHAVFTAIVTRRKQREAQITERVSRISLVDLAGSERAGATMATGARLREGARINQSLAALGKVISALADQGRRPPAPSSSSQASSMPFVPYRDSVLTWLLKDSLGGNSRTFMIATVSPTDYGETLSTLRYASRARHIVNVATVNEDATAKLVRQLREEITELQRQLRKRAAPSTTASSSTSGGGTGGGGELEDQLAADEKLIAELNQSWEEKLQRTQTLQLAREQALAAMGISVDTDGQGQGVGLHAPRDIPHLVNLSEDPLMSECLVYNLKSGATVVGDDDSADIRLGGGVAQHHCVFQYNGDLIVRPIANSPVMVNGRRIAGPKRLRSGYRIVIGAYVFRLNHPLQAREDLLRAEQFGSVSSGSSISRPTTPSESATPESTSASGAWNATHNMDGRCSPSTWSESQQSEIPATVLSSSVPWRLTSAALPGQRRGSVVSEAGGLALLRKGVVASVTSGGGVRRRPRGQTTSVLGAAQLQQHRPGAPAESLVISTESAGEHEFYSRRLARAVLGQWRRHKLVTVGETMLRNAIHIKEANVISKELGQKVIYQFTVMRGGAETLPESPLEPDALPALLAEGWDAISVDEAAHRRVAALDNPASERTVPHVAVAALDIAHACWYAWPIDVFLERLEKMRRLSTVKGSYRAHLVLDPFHANPAPRYSCIGTATYPIWPGERPYSARFDCPVIDPLLTALPRARATGSLAALPVRRNSSDSSSPSGASRLPRVWNVIVHVKALHGIDERELTAVHCRLRLARIPGLLSSTRADRPLISPILSPSAFVGNYDDDAEGGFSSSRATLVTVSASLDQSSARFTRPISGFGNGPVNLQFRQQWTVDMLTEDTCVVIEFFARAQPPALRRAFHEDILVEEALCKSQRLTADTLAQQQQETATMYGSGNNGEDQQQHLLSASQNLLVERLHEEELFVDSLHEVVMWIRVLELGADGRWERAPCVRSTHLQSQQLGSASFVLRQGLQRRIVAVVAHNSSQNMVIRSAAAALHVGNPVLVDSKGRLARRPGATTATEITLPISSVQLAAEHPRVDNRSFITVVAPWDTSVYGSPLLDSPTARGMRVKLDLRLSLEIENGLSALHLRTAAFVQMFARQSTVGRSWLANLTESAAGFLRSGMSTTTRIPTFISPPPPPQSSASNTTIFSIDTQQPAEESRRSFTSIYSYVDQQSSNSSQDNDVHLPPRDPVFRMFSVTLAPVAPARSKESLWRLNTGKKYVRGEEMLLPWKPRSVRFVEEYRRLECIEAWRLTVARTRERLEELAPLLGPTQPTVSEEEREAILTGAADLSLEQLRTRQLVLEAVRRFQCFKRVPSCSSLNLQQEPSAIHTSILSGDTYDRSSEPAAQLPMSASDIAEPSSPMVAAVANRRASLNAIRQLVCRHPQTVRPISMQGHFSHRGWVEVLDTNSGPDVWVRRWLVVERPYVFVFLDKDTTYLDNVINISSARISVDHHVAELVSRPSVLALYTNTNSYLISPPAEDVQQWISAIDEWYFML
ncbi:hypothetical protein H4R24_000874 [Coemansia sp. RSA 988]|nr:hypothetical protein H4R24_000874 [Coemansia sp. RSA 988]